jgi:hypothetical protein
LLVPDVRDRKAADWTLETAVPLLRRAARGPVEGVVGGADPVASVRDAVRAGNFDEIIISTLPKGVSKWLRRDLVSQTERLGLPVTAIVPGGGSLSNQDAAKMLLELGPGMPGHSHGWALSGVERAGFRDGGDCDARSLTSAVLLGHCCPLPFVQPA